MASIFMGGLFSVIGRSHFFWQIYGQIMGNSCVVWNVEEHKEQNRKECDENRGSLLAD
jgi:hypothetical protein